MNAILKYKTYMMIAAFVLVVIAVIYFVGRRAGKNASNNPWQASLPDDIGTGSSNTVEWAKIRRISDDLYADLDKWDWSVFTMTRNVDIYEEFDSLSDTEFVAVYNDWNARFSSEFKGKSIRVVIKDEIGWGLASFNSLRRSLELRFERLKLV